MPARCSLGRKMLLTAALVLPALAGRAQHKPTGAEQSLFDSANRERKARHLSPLKWNDSLAAAAGKHARLMARKNYLSHQFPGEPSLAVRAMQEGARFAEVAENVAEAPSAGVIHAQWMKSPPHRGNLLDPDLDSIGIAVAERNGQFFAVEDFARAVPALTINDQERQMGVLLKEQGLHLVDNRDDARRACAADGGYGSQRQPLYMFRYETEDLSDLPAALLKQIKRGRYHSAAAGACAPHNTSAFTSYRLAVLLY